MLRMPRIALVTALVALVAVGPFAVGAAAPAPAPAPLDLAAPFGTPSPWRLTVAQGPQVESPVGTEPGVITLCLSRNAGKGCDPAPNLALRPPTGDDVFAAPHYLRRAQVVQANSGLPLLLIELASVHAGNGDQRVSLQLYRYDRANDRFHVAYEHRTSRNNNQEMRFVETGPLTGTVITAEPTDDAPYGYWVTLNRPSAAGVYRQHLRFRSATVYGDGNPLAVIDSEMPNIHRRLGLWRPGQPLPQPPGGCARPRLLQNALWCD